MNVLHRLSSLPLLIGLVLTTGHPLNALPNESIAQTPTSTARSTDSVCPEPALSRLVRHRVAPGETLVSISQRYNLIPATLMGFNPALRNGTAPVGSTIVIPPYNGIRVEVPQGRRLRDIAAAYNVRADVLFEVNGCQESPRVAFIPGVNWSPVATPTATTQTTANVLGGYPLPNRASVLTGYGWQLDSASGEVVYNSGVDLSAAAGTQVLAVGDGTVAFAGNQGNYGNLIVINHAQGLQTRYARLERMNVRVGQTVRRGDRIGTVGTTGAATTPHLHFEVRSNSDLGWVAQNPANYINNVELR